MEIVTWNIQAALGIDKQVNIPRIAEEIKGMGNPDVICLQEVSRECHRVSTSGFQFTGMADDLWALFPEYEMYFGPAIDRSEDSGRYFFGNMVLAKQPVNHVFNHKLPQPADPTVRNMARQAIEIIVSHNDSFLRVITTHLEFFAVEQRAAQLEYLKKYQQECRERYENKSPTGTGTYVSPPETDRTIICGDFNLEAGTRDYQSITSADDGFIDAWRVAHGDKPHEDTCGIYDHEQWPDGGHCRDFFLLSESLSNDIVGVVVNTQTQASDHQPLKLVLR